MVELKIGEKVTYNGMEFVLTGIHTDAGVRGAGIVIHGSDPDSADKMQRSTFEQDKMQAFQQELLDMVRKAIEKGGGGIDLGSLGTL